MAHIESGVPNRFYSEPTYEYDVRLNDKDDFYHGFQKSYSVNLEYKYKTD